MSSPAANETVLCDLIRELLMSNDAVLNDKISLRENSLVQGRVCHNTRMFGRVAGRLARQTTDKTKRY